MNKRLIHLKWVLVDQIVDLTTATCAIRDHVAIMNTAAAPSSNWSVCYFRMCSTSLLIALAKLWEALNHYGKEINDFPDEIRSACIALKKEIENRKIYQFRSKYAAHIIDKDTHEPISLAEGDKRYKEIVGEDVRDLLNFCDWIYPQEVQANIAVITVVTKARDHCLSLVGHCNERP
jgi:hypothetical protein